MYIRNKAGQRYIRGKCFVLSMFPHYDTFLFLIVTPKKIM